MSRSINQCLLIGNVGRDPDIRTVGEGAKVATFSLATSTGGYRKQDGTEVPEKTQWHEIVCWRGLADLAERYVHKGDRITVLGTIQYQEYEKDGIKRRATDILAYDLVLGGKQDNPGARPRVTADDAPTRDDFPQAPMGNDLPF